jgi:hypothetical protein
MARVTWKTIVAIAARLPGVEVGTSYGTPALRVKKTFLARLKEDGETLVLRLNDDLREALLGSEPELFYLTDHYQGSEMLLVRLPRIERARMAQLLEIAWRGVAPARLRALRPGG